MPRLVNIKDPENLVSAKEGISRVTEIALYSLIDSAEKELGRIANLQSGLVEKLPIL